MSVATDRTRMVLDASPGVDAALALAWAATAPSVELEAVIGTWGNVSCEQATRNSLVVLEAVGSGAPAYVGASGAVGPAPSGAPATLVYGNDGLADVGVADPVRGAEAEPGAEAIVRLAREYPGEVTLVCCAPPSTVAGALALDPALPERLARLVIMGGSIDGGGNLTAAAEANVGHDPAAAAAVVEAFGEPGGAPGTPRMVTLDTSLRAVLGEAERDALARAPWTGAALLHRIWSAAWPVGVLETAGRGWPSYDLLTTMSAVHPALCAWERLPVAVDTRGGAAWGATVVDRRVRLMDAAGLDGEARAEIEVLMGVARARWDLATDVDLDGFRGRARAWAHES